MKLLKALRQDRVGTLFAFVLLVVVGRQFTPRSSSAATVDDAGDFTTPTPTTDASTAPTAAATGLEGYFLEQGPGSTFQVRNTRGALVAEGLSSAQLAAHFPMLNPGLAAGAFSVHALRGP